MVTVCVALVLCVDCDDSGAVLWLAPVLCVDTDELGPVLCAVLVV